MSQSKTLVSDFLSGNIILDAKKDKITIFSDLIVTIVIQFDVNGMFDRIIVEFELSYKLGKLNETNVNKH